MARKENQLSPREIEKIKRLWTEGVQQKVIAQRFGVSPSTVNTYCKGPDHEIAALAAAKGKK